MNRAAAAREWPSLRTSLVNTHNMEQDSTLKNRFIFPGSTFGKINYDGFITARSSYASAVLEIVIVRLSVTRMLCDETKEHIADILILHERVITLVF